MRAPKRLSKPLSPGGKSRYECACGTEFLAQASKVNRGEKLSCGCLHLAAITTHAMSSTRLYKVWAGMKARCRYKGSPSYANYGGRGIQVCAAWTRFEPFMKWAAKAGYSDELFLDRRDNHKGYSPSNCRFVTRDVSNANTRRLRANNTSGYRGVFLDGDRNLKKPWYSYVSYQGKRSRLGYFATAEEAAKAYDKFVSAGDLPHPLNFK